MCVWGDNEFEKRVVKSRGITKNKTDEQDSTQGLFISTDNDVAMNTSLDSRTLRHYRVLNHLSTLVVPRTRAILRRNFSWSSDSAAADGLLLTCI